MRMQRTVASADYTDDYVCTCTDQSINRVDAWTAEHRSMAASASHLLFFTAGFGLVEARLARVGRAARPQTCVSRLCIVMQAQPSVLVVDDDAMLRGAVSTYLSQSGFNISQAGSAKEGLALARHDRPQLLVLDVMMPGTSGLEMLQQLRTDPTLATTPVVLLTARGFTADRIAGYQAGCSAYITKPFDPEELVAIIRSLLEADGRYAARSAAAVCEARREGSRDERFIPSPALASASAANAGALMLGAVANVPLDDGGLSERLARREHEVLRLVSRGMMNKEIAREMNISQRMVENYVSRLLAKSGTSTRTELARLAVKTGLAE